MPSIAKVGNSYSQNVRTVEEYEQRIDAGRLRSVLDTGVDAAVVLGAVCRGDVASNCKRLLALAREVR